MEIWKLLLITLLSAVVLGCVIGVLVGRHQLKKQSAGYRPLLSTRERILYAACILIGAGCIAFGVLYHPPQPEPEEGAVMGMEDGMLPEDGDVDGGVTANAGGARPRRGGGGTVEVFVG